ncbi:hypothetical protein FJ365_05800 [Candidatus Dependentiae bacterium]|nr:hypothetical protein [Candidatus Dependentiae bacterium]
MLLFFIKLCFFVACLTSSAAYATDYATDDYFDAFDSTDPFAEEGPIEQSMPTEKLPVMPDPTQATPEPPVPPPAIATPDASVPNSQLQWPDTSSLEEKPTEIVPANAIAALNTVYDQAQKAVTTINTSIAEMLEKRKNLYNEFFTQNSAADDFIQDQQITIGSLMELFNPSDKKKE